MARVFVAEDKDVLLGAADTFRAAAAEQLATWGARVGVPTVKSDVDGADPASVAFEAVKAGIDAEVDVVMIDTAGRLQNKVGLMDELGKVKRVIEKQATVDEVLLVLDATTGQNGLTQAKVFADVVNITGTNYEMPQNQLQQDGNYATNASEGNGDTKSTGSGKEESENEQAQTQSGKSRTKGYQSSPVANILAARSAIVNVDQLIIGELNQCFMFVWDTQDDMDPYNRNGYYF